MGYYKVDYGSVKLLRMFTGHRGDSYSYKEFVETYPTCAWCTANTNPNLDTQFSSDGQIVCHECAQDKEIAPFLSTPSPF